MLPGYLSVSLSLSLSSFFGFVVGGFVGFVGVFFSIVWEEDHFLFRVCTAPMEVQSMTEDRDNRVTASDYSLRSNYCGGSNCCLSF